MIIKSMILKDFRQYKGTQEIKFSTDSEKNVTVILGLNTSGKTTIIEAFKWCLYNTTGYRKSDLLNVETEQELGILQNEEVYVEITIIHSNNEYIIRRTQNYYKGHENKMTLKESNVYVSYNEGSGEWKQVISVETQDVINTILPAELADYFFFDGERIGDIGKKSDIKNAVQGLMGLNSILEAKNRFDPKRKNSVINRFESKLDIGSDRTAEKLIEDISNKQDELEEYKKNFETVKGELEYFNMKFDKLTQEIAANQSVKEVQEKRNNLERDLKKDKESLKELSNRIRKKFLNESCDFFSIPVSKKATQTVNSTKEEVEGIVGMSAKAIDHIINRGICICGKNLEKDEDSKNKVLYEKTLLPPYHIGTMVNQAKISYKIIENRGYEFKDDIMRNFELYEDLRNKISDKEKTLKDISKNLETNINVGQLEIDRNDCRSDIDKLENKRDLILINIGSSENNIETLKKHKGSLAIASDRNIEIYECLNYSNNLFKQFEKDYKAKETIVKESLEKNVNDIFENIYHGKRYLRIDEDYRVNLDVKVKDDMIETDLSEGLEAVKNFSFVAGLVKIAKEKVQDPDDPSIEEPYPLVMDAPFSNVDEIHISNISKVLPGVSEQVIWILMKKDWNYAKDSLEEKVGYIYDIEKINNSDTYSKVKGRKAYV